MITSNVFDESVNGTSGSRTDTAASQKNCTRTLQTVLVYISLLLDNVLLTVIVPILPDYLAHLQTDNAPVLIQNLPNSVAYKTFDLHYVPRMLGKHPLIGSTGSMINFTSSPFRTTSASNDDYIMLNSIGSNATTTRLDPVGLVSSNATATSSLTSENGSIGILLATKALVQLVITPFVGSLTLRLGYRIPIVFGTFCLLVASLVFASGSSYTSLLLARSMQGIASACIGVCGMSLIAQLYPEDSKRSRVMGVILGSVALGVLLGYPFGGILYDFVGKSAPFCILAFGILANLIIQMITMDLKDMQSEMVPSGADNAKPCVLLTDPNIFKIIIAIWISTSAMAILEPCLPIWLIENMHPKKWQIGTVFIPDSIGYFIGTNFFASIAFHFGQMNVSVLSLVVVGISCFIIPASTTVLGLLIPHFTLGLGIGVLDAALIPMLATLVDARYIDDETEHSECTSNYGSVYAIQQMSVSLAYSLGPIIGGEIAQYMGFKWLMFIVGTINLTYGVYLFILVLQSSIKHSKQHYYEDTLHLTENNITTAATARSQDYKRFYNTIEIP